MAGKKKKAEAETEAVEAATEERATVDEPMTETVAEPAVESAPESGRESSSSGGSSWPHFHTVFGLYAPMVMAVIAMMRVKRFTVDDSYISFRYARNLANGLGLVYNEGERVEGYTNFLWTVLLAAGIKVGIDPDLLAKLLGAACALGAIALLHRISGRLRPYGVAPCLSTWLLATSAPNLGYAVFGLETSLFVVLVLGGMSLFFDEEEVFGGSSTASDRLRNVPWSGVVFGLAGLTRPEAPAYIGIVMLFLGVRGLFSKRNLLRGGLFVGIVGAHLLFRHSYYGAWVPNTLGAKTGNLDGQLVAGWAYVQHWMEHTQPLALFILFGIGYAIWKKQRTLLAISALTVFIFAYVILVGGDWMQNFRFLVPFEPFAFLLVDVSLRALWDRLASASKDSERRGLLALGLAAAFSVTGFRIYKMNEMHRFILATEDRFWRMAAGGTAKAFLQHPKGAIAMGDIGYVGYATDYPILDLLGLVDVEIAHMPGGYTQKVGKPWLDYFFKKAPRYAVVISSKRDCEHPSVHGSVVMWNDPRFREQYQKLALTPLDNDFAWCIYERRDAQSTPAVPPRAPTE